MLAAVVLLLGPPAMADTWTVDPGGGSDYTTIQAAINGASAGDTINVVAGTYQERLNVSKTLTILGAQAGVDPTASGARTNTALESIVTESGLGTPNPDVLVEIPSGVPNVVLDGFTLSGDPTNTTADTSVVRCWDDHITVSNNIIDGRYGVLYKGNDYLTADRNRFSVNKAGVAVQPNTATNIVVSDNTFGLGTSPDSDAAAVYMTGCTDVEVTGNSAEGFYAGVRGSNLTDIDVSGNTLRDNRDGVSFWGSTTFVDIEKNTITGSTRHGINIKGQDITIDCNRIANSGDCGVNIARHVIDTERVSLSGNDIYGNTNYGVCVDTANVTETVTAESNWWGDATGPTHTGNPGGVGDAVTDLVDYDPFLTSESPCAPPVPEPAGLGLLGLGLLGVVRRKKRS
jgi:hypothetical protein